MRSFLEATAFCLLAAAALPTAAQPQAPTYAQLCGPLPNAYGPYDYRRDRDKLHIVEVAHFTTEVENLIRGKSATLGGDIDYTLRAFPNHHRALLAAMRLGKKQGNKPPGMNYPVDCYFDRAVRFTPDDTVVRGLYAIYLRENNRKNEAEGHLDVGVRAAGDNAISHFNLGLQYAELQLWDKAVAQAKTAEELGLPRTELIDLLRKAGKWPAVAAAAPSASTAAPAAAAASSPR